MTEIETKRREKDGSAYKKKIKDEEEHEDKERKVRVKQGTVEEDS